MSVNANVVPQILAGPGILFLTRNDIANQTPVNIGYCQEFSTSEKRTVKSAFGQNTYALLTVGFTTKLTAKVKAAATSGLALNACMWGGTFTAGTQWDLTVDPNIACPSTPFQVTPTPPNTGTYEYDLGVTNAVTGEPLTYVTGTPSTGQYSEGTGTYTFSSGDHTAGVTVNINYAYSYTSAAGQVITIGQSLIGSTPTVQLDYKTLVNGQSYMLTLFNCVASGDDIAHKLEDFAYPEYEFEMSQNAAGNIYRVSLATQA
jgi:hypothetical protein